MSVETSPPSVLRTGPALAATALNASHLTALDAMLALAIVLDAAGSALAARLALGWVTASAIDLIVCL